MQNLTLYLNGFHVVAIKRRKVSGWGFEGLRFNGCQLVAIK